MALWGNRNMIDSLIELLESFGYDVFRQGSLTENDPYPDTFITFWNPDTPFHSFYDNEEYGQIWTVNVYVYSNDPEVTYSLIDSIRMLLKRNGWIINGAGYDVTSDEPTHTGRGLDVQYIDF